jgi:hypothetical protein
VPHTMRYDKRILLSIVALSIFALPPAARSTSCTTQSQIPAPARDRLANRARTMILEMQSGDVASLKANTIPAVATNFSAIESSVQSMKTSLLGATITVDELYLLDSDNTTGNSTDFFCGSPVVALTFNGLPAGNYAFSIIHATGVKDPKQFSLILSKTTDDRWLLAGFFTKPMTIADHDGLWYWVSARKYAQSNMLWNASFYYRLATSILTPLDSMSSPNLDKLKNESGKIHPEGIPDKTPVPLHAGGTVFAVNSIDTSTALGGLDLDVRYNPSPAQATQLQDPQGARIQVTAIMSALLQQHPELHEAFHGIWVHADQGTNSLFALELPMDQLTSVPPTPTAR